MKMINQSTRKKLEVSENFENHLGRCRKDSERQELLQKKDCLTYLRTRYKIIEYKWRNTSRYRVLPNIIIIPVY